MKHLYLRGIGMMVGMMFGAGMFALPYSFSQSGIFWGVILFAAAFFVMYFLQFMYGEITYFTKGRHRFTGYVEIFLGNRAKQFAFLTTAASYYGTLLIYGLLGGLFISNFWGGAYKFEASLFFFLVAGILVFLNLSKVADINFYLTLPLFGFVIYLVLLALPSVRVEIFFANIDFGFQGDWFLPYGIWLFSLSGFAALPEARDIFSSSSIKHFKRMIAISLVLSAIFYFLFVFAIWGASNDNTTQDALSGIVGVLGKEAFLAGSLIGLLAVFTSFLSMATDMKNIFKYDYKISKFWAGFLTVIVPPALFFLGAIDFASILSLIGVLGFGTFGIFILLMYHAMRKKIKNGAQEDILRPLNGYRIKTAGFVEIIIWIGLLAGAAYELWQIFL